MPFKSHKLSATALALVVGFAATAGSAADSVNRKIISFDPYYLMVVSNGIEYTQLKTKGTIRIRGYFSYDTGQNGRIKSWEFWPKISYTTNRTRYLPGTRSFAQGESYSSGNRPKSVGTSVPLDVPASFVAHAAVMACNKTAADLRGAGAPNATIFSKERAARIQFTPEYQVDLTGLKSDLNDQGGHTENLPVKCLKHSGPTTPQVGTIRPSDPATPWLQAPAGTQPDPVPDTSRPKRLLKIRG